MHRNSGVKLEYISWDLGVTLDPTLNYKTPAKVKSTINEYYQNCTANCT